MADTEADFVPSRPSVGSEHVPTWRELMRLRDVAGGRAPGDIIVRGGSVLALHTGEILERDVVVAGRHIAAVTPVGRFDAPEIIDAAGLHVAPNFIDAHVHIEYTKLTPGELARLSVPKGTTSVLADPNCIGNVLGAEGFDIVGRTGTPMRIFRQVTPSIPSKPQLELGGARVPDGEIVRRVQLPDAVALGESTPFANDEWMARKFAAALASGKRITGHTARLGGEILWSYLAGGVNDDHNAATTDEVMDRLRLGCMLTVMAGSMNDNTETVFANIAALKGGLHHICFCTDDKLVEDIDAQGLIDHHVRQAIRFGIDPVMAYRMATLNAASFYRLDHVIGSITPGRLADLQLIDDLAAARPALVMVGGAVVAREGVALFENHDPTPPNLRDTIRLNPEITEASFTLRVPGNTAWVQAVEMYDGYFKRAFHAEMPVLDGAVQCDLERDILKVAVVDRHHRTKSIGLGFVRGFGLQRGALAASTNCTNQNVVIVGTSDAEMAHALRAIEAIGGGLVAVAAGEVLGSVPLPLAGLMSDQPWEVVRDQSLAANAAAAGIGCKIHAPYMIMSFIGLAGVPDLGLTEKGLIETRTQSFIDVLLTMKDGMIRCRCPSHAYEVHRLMDPETASPRFVAEAV